MSFFDDFAFWRALLEALGARVVLSDPTNQAIAQDGIDLAVAEPCYPVKLAHGHFMDLINKRVDAILIPNVLDVEAPDWTRASHHCPWNQTLPFVLRTVTRFEPCEEKLLIPTLRFRDGAQAVQEALRQLLPVWLALHRQGVHVEIASGERKLKAELERANRLKASHVVIVGENELKAKSALLRDMATGNQRQLALDHLQDQLLEELNGAVKKR